MATKFENPIVRWIDHRLPIFSFMHHELHEYPTPKNLNYWWNFGSLAGIALVIMLVTGITLAMHYTPHVDHAFNSVERIMRDVNYGWLIRYIHMNGASFFFIVVYIHIFRGLYFGSYKAPRELLWMLGVVIMLLMMATAFMGYVLPWGQMSFWGATVITNLFSAIPVIGEGPDAMVWTVLIAHAAGFDPALINVAFVFLLLGYGTKVGLVPLHAWLPDAHAEGPTPISAVLSGLLLNVALYALLRFKLLMAANPGALATGPLMMAMGLASLLFAALMLYRRRDIKRMFAYSSIEHMGIIVFAFGIGGPLANFAGLLHMVMHSLTKSAIFFAVGHITQVKGTQRMADIGGLTESHPWLGWSLVVGVVAIAGLPPTGVFMSEFLLISSTFAREPLLAILLVLGLLLAFGALLLRVGALAFGEIRGPVAPVKASYLPMLAHLTLVLVAGVYLPAPVVAWFRHIAALLG